VLFGSPTFPSFNPQQRQPGPVPVVVQTLPVKECWYKKRWVLLLIVILVVLCILGFMGRKRFLLPKKNKFTDKIEAIKNAEQQADLREWSLLWSKAKRPNVKAVLEQVLNSELSPAPAAMQAPPPPPPAEATNNDATADPGFTVA
jgi:hypothetical protein